MADTEKLIDEITKRSGMIEPVEYGQVTLVIQAGKVVRVDVHQSDLVKKG